MVKQMKIALNSDLLLGLEAAYGGGGGGDPGPGPRPGPGRLRVVKLQSWPVVMPHLLTSSIRQ